MIRWIRNIFVALIIAMGFCLVLFSIATGGFPEFFLDIVTVLVLLFAAVLTFVLVVLALTRFSFSRVNQRSIIILSYIEQAVRLNLPLPKMLTAAEASEPRWIGYSIQRLREQLEHGHSIADALQESVPGTSRRSMALIGSAERVGRVGPELGYLLRQEKDQQNRNIADRSFIRIYPAAMICVIVGILSMIMIFVIPKYMQIFSDFRVPLPPLTVAVIHFDSLPFDIAWFALSVAIVLLAVLAQQIHRLDLFGPARWFASNRDLADICHVIAEGLDAGLPLNAAIRGAVDLRIGDSMRHKLHRWADGIERGMNSVDAAHAAGMPKLIAGLTVTKEGFEFLSRYYAGKFSRLAMLLRGAAIPAMVFFFGIIVAIVALTLFLPIVKLIDSVGPGMGPYSSWL